MKTSKLLIIALAYTILSASSINSLISSDKPEEHSDDFVSKIIRDSGINKAVNVTRDNIKDIWYKVLNRLYPEDYPLYEDSFKGMVEKYIAELPDAMPRIDLAKYFSQERMTKFLQETQKTYGEKFAGYMRGAFDRMKSLWYSVAGQPHEETFTEKVKRIVVENTPDMIKDAIKTDV